MGKPYQLYYREESDFVLYVNTIPPDENHVMIVAFYKPTGKIAQTIKPREEWDDYGYDARQGVWSALAYRARHG